jgi:glucokinase
MADSDAAGPVLVADIGGTNARFALARPGPDRPVLERPTVLPAARFASLQQAANHYLDEHDIHPSRAAFAVASPVTGDEIRMTNRAWSFHREELRTALGCDELQVINDFGATARAVPALHDDECAVLYGETSDALAAPVTVIGPGTGMGVALLTRFNDQWQVIETEGGHISYAPHGAEERCIHEWLKARHDRVSIERVLSGIGLSRIHAALAGLDPAKTTTPDHSLRASEDIARAALSGEDQAARRALARFCAILGSVAGDAALIHGSRTVTLAGGIVPCILSFLRASAFRERFLNKGRFAAYLESVRIQVITHPTPGLLGAALTALEPGVHAREAK